MCPWTKKTGCWRLHKYWIVKLFWDFNTGVYCEFCEIFENSFFNKIHPDNGFWSLRPWNSVLTRKIYSLTIEGICVKMLIQTQTVLWKKIQQKQINFCGKKLDLIILNHYQNYVKADFITASSDSLSKALFWWWQKLVNPQIVCLFKKQQKQPPEVFCEKGVVKDFSKFTEKYLWLRPATLLKTRLQHTGLGKFLRIPFLHNTPGDCFWSKAMENEVMVTGVNLLSRTDSYESKCS